MISKLLIVISAAIAITANATTYYADASSQSSKQDGSLNYPWKTIAQVNSNMSKFKPGDSILFRRGKTFIGSLNIILCSGVVFAAYGTGNAPVFQYNISANLSKPVTQRTIVYAAGISNVTLDGIRFTDTTVDTINIHTAKTANVGYAIDFEGSSTTGCNGITIQNCDISLVGNAIEIHGNGNTITNCIIHDLGGVKNNTNDQGNFGANGITFGGSNNTITHNTFLRCWRTDLTFKYDGGAIEQYGGVDGQCSNNQVTYNTVIDCDGVTEWGSGSKIICDNNVFAYNLLINNTRIASLHTSQEAISNFQIYNNDIIETVNQFEPKSSMISCDAAASANTVVFKNNIVWHTSSVPTYWRFANQNGKMAGSAFIHTDNIYKMVTGALGFTIGATEISSATVALFTDTTQNNPVNWNYTLIAGSPAIDHKAGSK